MLAPWLDSPAADEQVDAWSDLAQVDLRWAGTIASADAIRATEVAQPLLAATALLAARGLQPDVLTGHSVGSWSAAAIAGVLSPDDAMRMVGLRGRAMAACCDGTTGMSAVLGGIGVLDAIAAHGLTAANVNTAGQVVAAGSLTRLAALAADPPSGARVRSLPVAGAFHTAAMAPAAETLAAQVLPAADPVTTLIADTDGTVVTDGAAQLRTLAAATALPVRFDLVLARLAALGVDTVVELAPAGVLAGLVTRALPGCRVVKLDAPAAVTA